MAKTLELQFTNEQGKIAKISIENPVEPVDPQKVSDAMDTIITADVFLSPGGRLVAKKGARVVERNTMDIELV